MSSRLFNHLAKLTLHPLLRARVTGALQVRLAIRAWLVLLAVASVISPVAAQSPTTSASTAPAAPLATAAGGVVLPPDYLIGPDDVLSIVVWREKDLSVDVMVRPDGRITLPLVNDVVAQGLSPETLRARLAEAFEKFIEEPSVTVVVKQINSRKVFITGMVGRGGAYNITGPTTVLQLISMAGGLQDFAKSKEIVIMRNDNGKQRALKFNFEEVRKGKNVQQNLELQPGDTVIVP